MKKAPDDIPDIHPWKRGTARNPHYYARYRYRGEPQVEPTGARTLVEFETAKQKIEDLFRAGTWTTWEERKKALAARAGEEIPDLFRVFALVVLAKRIKMGVKSADKDERGHIKNHLTPEFGDERLADVAKYKREAEGFERIGDKPELGGATLRNIYLTFRTIMRFAAKAGHIDAEPPLLTVRDGELPAVIERRPEGWRDEALFDIDEIALILAAEHIELQYRCMYAVYFLTGSRFSEVTTLRFRDYDRKRKPLGMLTIKAGKLGRARNVMYRTPPVHPALAVWLNWWVRRGLRVHASAQTSPRRPDVPERFAAPEDHSRARDGAGAAPDSGQPWRGLQALAAVPFARTQPAPPPSA